MNYSVWCLNVWRLKVSLLTKPIYGNSGYFQLGLCLEMGYFCSMNKMTLLVCLFLFSLGNAQTDTLTIVAYNVLNFPDGRNDCSNNTLVPNRADTLRKVLSYIQPDIFVACEIQTEAGADSILTRALNVNGNTNFTSAQWHPNTNGGSLNNQMYYNTDKLVFYSQDVIQTSSRDIDHYVLYANDPNLATFYDTTFFEIYMCHLKAGNGSSNANIRAAQTQLLMDYIATRPTDHHHFVCGDLNVYNSSEPGYQNLIAGPLALQDPISSPGNWNNNSSFAALHTQSTRTSVNLDCGSKGGSDDRFDQILVSSNVMAGIDSVEYLPGSYDAVGNDGNHFNTNLLNGANSQYPDSVVRALYFMSDHLPVAMDVVITYPTSNGLALYPLTNPVSCAGAADGQATIVANQGQPPYSYQWDVAAGNATTATVSGLTSGTYCVQVTDNLGQTDSYCVFVGSPQPLTFNTFILPDNDNCNGTIHLLIEGGVEPYSYEWDDPQAQTTASVYDLCGGDYQVVVTDAQGCELIIDITVQTVSIIEQWLEKVKVSPNPTNGILKIESAFDLTELRVLDVFGRIVKTQENKFDGSLLWDVSELQPGSYFLVFSSAESPTRKGRIRFVKY